MTDIFALFDKIKSGTPAPAGPITHIVAGLGNPGEEYAATRHNTGFLCLDTLARQAGARVTTLKFDSLTADAVIGGKHVLLMKPQTYMNLSGNAVAAAAAFYKIPAEHIIVLCDDVLSDVGHIRIRLKGSHGGHNGLRNIAERLGSENYVRVKVGVGRKPNPEYDLAAWVLGKFSPADMDILAQTRGRVADAVTLLLSDKPEEAMSRYSS